VPESPSNCMVAFPPGPGAGSVIPADPPQEASAASEQARAILKTDPGWIVARICQVGSLSENSENGTTRWFSRISDIGGLRAILPTRSGEAGRRNS
jgi:hypothetical protein